MNNNKIRKSANTGTASQTTKNGAEADAKVEVIKPLTKGEKTELAKHESVIKQMKLGIVAAFFAIAAAFHEIKVKKLYRGTHTSFEAYFQDKWNYGRAHAYRLAYAGEIIERVYPNGDTKKLLNSESHFRPVLKLTPEEQLSVVRRVGEWAKLADQKEVNPAMVESAVAFIQPAKGAAPADVEKNDLVAKFVAAVTAGQKELPKEASKPVRRVFENIKKKARALGNARRTSGIDWTEATWNPLQGCARASAGCDHCYAAKLVATRLAGVYPGLATEVKGKDGKKSYMFKNIIKLLPEQLGDPLTDRQPKRYFVNSMSDLFHDKVPDEFVEAVFQVMEKATWHTFQVLTKRPKRMGQFTTKYFKDRTPPANIWLGTSTENQKALDDRYPHLLNVKAAVRWLSIEPLIGPITFDSLDGVDWVVVGGESGSTRKMERDWVIDIRDACKKAKAPFFFKQWGEFGEDGQKLKKVKKDGLTPMATLEGVIHNAYPEPVVQEAKDGNEE